MAQRKGGRPSKFTPDVRKAIIDGVTAGLTYTHVCRIVGIEYETFNQWRKKGAALLEKDDDGYFEFSEMLTRAEHQTSLSMMANIRKCAQGYKLKRSFVNKKGELITYEDDVPSDWRASAWWLERRYPDEYGRQRIEVTGKDGGAIEVKAYQNFTPDEWDTDDKPDPS